MTEPRMLNPLTSLAVAVALVMVTYVVPSPWAAMGALVMALVLAASMRVLRRVLLLAAAVAIPTWLLLAFMNAIVAPMGDVVRIAGIAVAPHALLPAAAIALRLAAAVAALGWMIATTSPLYLVRALSQRGFPAWSQYLLAASLAAVPEARRRAREVLDAQRCRGLAVGGGALGRLRAIVPLAGPLMVSLVTDAERHAVALDARAFNARARRTSLVPVSDPPVERVLRLLLWIATAGLAIAGFIW